MYMDDIKNPKNPKENENEDQEPIIELWKDKKKKPSKKKKNLKIVFHAAFLAISGLILIGIVVIFGTYIKYASEFDSKKPESNSTQLVFYDKNGKEIFRDY